MTLLNILVLSLYAVVSAIVATACVAEIRNRRQASPIAVAGALTAGVLWPVALGWTILSARVALRAARIVPLRTAGR